MKLYLAGPMSGYDDLNYPAFNTAAAELREAGHQVINPSENWNPSGLWDEWLRISLRQVLSVEAIAVLPDWEESKGARLEVHVAKELGMAIGAWRTFL